MIVIAHRGASAYAPENTEAAFDLGLAQGADALETDVRATRDGVLALLHDARMERAIAAGVDGVTIDFPDRLIRRLGRAPGGEQKEGP